MPHTHEASFVSKHYAYQTTLVATASVTTDHGAGRLGPEERRRFGRCAQTACTRYTLERFIHTRLHRPGRVCSLLAPGAMQKALARMQPPAAHRPRETCGRNSRAASTNRVVAKTNAAERVVEQGIAYTWSARLVALTRQPTTHRPPDALNRFQLCGTLIGCTPPTPASYTCSALCNRRTGHGDNLVVLLKHTLRSPAPEPVSASLRPSPLPSLGLFS